MKKELEKRDYFLEKLERVKLKGERFNSFLGRNIFRKIIRLLYSRREYLIYLLWKFHFIPRNKRNIKLFWGKTFVADLLDEDIIIQYIFGALAYSEAEYRLTKFLIKNLKDKDIFYDIGANYGFYSYLAGEFCSEVHLFEPLPDIFENINFNLSSDKKFFLNNLALSDKVGKDTLLISRSSGVSTLNNKFANLRTDVPVGSYNNSVEINTITLDLYCQSKNKPTIIKLDVEGAEELVLRGAENFLKENSPILIMEVCSSYNGGEVSMLAVEMLRRLKFISYKINSFGELEKIEGDLAKKINGSEAFDNFVFLK